MRRARPRELFALLSILSMASIASLAACSGGGSEGAGSAPAETSAPPAGSASAARPPAAGGQGSGQVSGKAATPEAELRAAQTSAVKAMCERLVECAVESARANMSPDEVAKLDLDETAPRLRDECEAEGARAALSPRQVRVVQRCVNEAATCDALQSCLEEAKKPAP